MKNTFTTKQNDRVWPYDFIARNNNTSTYSGKGLRIFRPKLWNTLRTNIKSETPFIKFKE